MPQITLDLADATELAETLTFIADRLSGSQEQVLAESLAAFVGHPAYSTETLRADLHRSSSSSASATVRNSSASRRHGHQHHCGEPG